MEHTNINLAILNCFDKINLKTAIVAGNEYTNVLSEFAETERIITSHHTRAVNLFTMMKSMSWSIYYVNLSILN